MSNKRLRRSLSPDAFEAMEEAAASMANSINITACKALGVQDSFIEEWSEGVKLTGAEGMDTFSFDDYPNLKNNAEIAAIELDRLTARQKIFWYPECSSLANLSVCPGNLILNGSRPRVVQD